MKNKKIVLIIVIALSIFTLVACTKDNNENQNSITETEESQQVEDSLDKVDDTDKITSPDSTNDTKENENIQEDNETNKATKVEGRKQKFLDKLDNIQAELDALPEKEDSDKGVTNAMKNYYGRSYEMYDEALNDIYALLKEELSPETMDDLQAKQIKWIEDKEDKANKEAAEYKGGTFENVARYISLYESTKERCYELVNEYMTD